MIVLNGIIFVVVMVFTVVTSELVPVDVWADAEIKTNITKQGAMLRS